MGCQYEVDLLSNFGSMDSFLYTPILLILRATSVSQRISRYFCVSITHS